MSNIISKEHVVPAEIQNEVKKSNGLDVPLDSRKFWQWFRTIKELEKRQEILAIFNKRDPLLTSVAQKSLNIISLQVPGYDMSYIQGHIASLCSKTILFVVKEENGPETIVCCNILANPEKLQQQCNLPKSTLVAVIAPWQMEALKKSYVANKKTGLILSHPHVPNPEDRGEKVHVTPKNLIECLAQRANTQKFTNQGVILGGVGSDLIPKEEQTAVNTARDALGKLIEEAIDNGASDISIIPVSSTKTVFRLRILIDYHDWGTLNLTQHGFSCASVISALKIAAGLLIEEKKFSQSGKIELSVEGKTYVLRVETCPCNYGESATIRIQDIETVPELPDIVFGNSLFYLEKAAKLQSGLILVVGPTGSGKSTTLASCFRRVATQNNGKKIITLEDPIEFIHPGLTIVQIPAKNKLLAGKTQHGHLTFSDGLRSVLRQDPDIILVGEMRDLETAKLAVEASNTGHLVYSSLHANSVIDVPSRLLGLGLKRYELSVLKLLMSQTLVLNKAKDGRVAAIEMLPISQAIQDFVTTSGEFCKTTFRNLVQTSEEYISYERYIQLLVEKQLVNRNAECVKKVLGGSQQLLLP